MSALWTDAECRALRVLDGCRVNGALKALAQRIGRTHAATVMKSHRLGVLIEPDRHDSMTHCRSCRGRRPSRFPSQEAYRDHRREMNARAYQTHKAAGRCVSCRKAPAEPDGVRCAKCRARRRALRAM